MGEQLTFEATYSIQYTYIIYSYIYIHVYRKACCGRATKHDIFPNIFHGLKKYWLFAVYTQAFSSGNRAYSLRVLNPPPKKSKKSKKRKKKKQKKQKTAKQAKTTKNNVLGTTWI